MAAATDRAIAGRARGRQSQVAAVIAVTFGMDQGDESEKSGPGSRTIMLKLSKSGLQDLQQCATIGLLPPLIRTFAVCYSHPRLAPRPLA